MANPNPSPLTRWKPGQSGNPAGKPKQIFTRHEAEIIFQKFAISTPADIQEVLKNPQSTAIELACAMAWMKAIASGNMPDINMLLDRGVGKVKEERETTNLHGYAERAEIIDGVPVKQLVEMVRKEPK